MSPLAVLALASALVASASAISGGFEAADHQFPHMAAIQFTMPGDPDPQPNFLCGGVLIAKNWVLTSADCAYAIPRNYANLTVAVGINSLTKDAGQRLEVAKVIPHNLFRTSISFAPFDIALFRLEGKFKLNSAVRLAHLPKAGALPTGNATVSGWGNMVPVTGLGTNEERFPDRLRAIDFTIMDWDTCYDFISESLSKAHNPLAESNVCGGPPEKYRATCQGDIGGPLFQKSGGKTTVVGIASWMWNRCGFDPSPAIFTRVSEYIHWIQRTMKESL